MADIERLGVPTVQFVTQPFEGFARMQLTRLGMPHCPIVTIPHPLITISSEEIANLASELTSQVISVLGRSREERGVSFLKSDFTS